MYIVTEGQLILEKTVQLINDRDLWLEVKNEIQRCEDDTCEKMFYHLVKDPKPKDRKFQVIFRIKIVSEGEIICARETLNE